MLPGTVVHALARLNADDAQLVRIEHPAGALDIRLDIEGELSAAEPNIVFSAGLIRAARPCSKARCCCPPSWTA